MRTVVVIAAFTVLVLATGTVSVRFSGLLLLGLIAVLVAMAATARRD